MPSPVRRPRLAVLLCAAAVLTAGDAMGASAPPYAALLKQALTEAPRLAETRADVARAQGLARQAATRPNPVLGLEVENFGGSGALRGLSGADTTATIAQTLELGGKRPARIAAGRAEVAAAQAADVQARAAYAAQLAVAYAEAEAAGRRLTLTEELLAAAREDARAAKALVEAGREAQLRALQAAAEEDAARADLDEARAARDAAFARLSALAGAPAPFDAVEESLLARAPSPAGDAAEPPLVIAARAEREAAAARVRAERLRGRPDVTVSAGVRRMAGDDATALVAGVSIPLPVFDRNVGATQAAQADLAAAEARLRQAELDVGADLFAARSQAAGAATRVDASSAGEGAAEEAYRLARIGYEAGRVPLLELTSARRTFASARVRSLDARLARVRAEAELARLSGRTPFGG